jgi:hypothetical protein
VGETYRKAGRHLVASQHGQTSPTLGDRPAPDSPHVAFLHTSPAPSPRLQEVEFSPLVPPSGTPMARATQQDDGAAGLPWLLGRPRCHAHTCVAFLPHGQRFACCCRSTGSPQCLPTIPPLPTLPCLHMTGAWCVPSPLLCAGVPNTLGPLTAVDLARLHLQPEGAELHPFTPPHLPKHSTLSLTLSLTVEIMRDSHNHLQSGSSSSTVRAGSAEGSGKGAAAVNRVSGW